MHRLTCFLSTLAMLSGLGAARANVVTTAPSPGTAGSVVSYVSGADLINSSYTHADAALGEMPRDTGSFGGTTHYVTPFNNPYSSNDLVSIGKGGHITLQLTNYALPQGDGPELGVFTFQQLLRSGGASDSGPTTFYPLQEARVEVSEDASTWVALNDGDVLSMNIPANGYNDADTADPTDPSDYHKPFVGTLDDLAHSTLTQLLATYDGSGGGAWLDLSATGLNKVGYVRFSVPATQNASFQLEGVSLANGASGAAVPEPTSLALLLAGAGFAGAGRRRRRRRRHD